ncbi:MAG: hypothetical protein KDC56_06225 [Flavobacteriaceae bacterium]|nr:hypothetical protein [Flavobacteriaceae bacterium]
MKILPTIVLVLSILFTHSLYCQTEAKETTDSILPQKELTVTIANAIINKSLWTQPYRFENDSLQSLTVRIVIEKNTSENQVFDPNELYLLDEQHMLRIRPTGIFYYKADKKVYYKSKPVNQNYNSFAEKTVAGYTNLEAKTIGTNFLGMKKKKIKASIPQLKSITIKANKITYFLDFPVEQGFSYGKIYYKDEAVGFAAVSGQ